MATAPRYPRTGLSSFEVWENPSEEAVDDAWIAREVETNETSVGMVAWQALAGLVGRWQRRDHEDRIDHARAVDKYTYTVSWDPDEQDFVATVAEHALIKAHASSQLQALWEVMDQVAMRIEVLEAGGDRIRTPPGLPPDESSQADRARRAAYRERFWGQVDRRSQAQVGDRRRRSPRTSGAGNVVRFPGRRRPRGDHKEGTT